MEKREFARGLRQAMTDVEKIVWRKLRARRFAAYKFRRQVPLGPFVADFLCCHERLVVELDGGQHVEQTADDSRRTGWMESQGFRVLRFWNHQILKEWDGAEQAIWLALTAGKGVG